MSTKTPKEILNNYSADHQDGRSYSIQDTISAIEEYAAQFLHPVAPETGKHKPFIVANVREIIEREFDETGVVSSKMVELLNEVAERYYRLVEGREVYRWVKVPVSKRNPVFEEKGLKAFYTDLGKLLFNNIENEWVSNDQLQDVQYPEYWLEPITLPLPVGGEVVDWNDLTEKIKPAIGTYDNDLVSGIAKRIVGILKKELPEITNIGGELVLPTDDEVENWFEENIGIINECSASSAIFKFRQWLKNLQS
jgi:hypothetical protein